MPEPLSSKIVLGLMSGTSVDGIDACLIKIRPDFSFEVIDALVLDYPDNIKQNIFKIFENKSSVEEICWMNFVIGEYFSKAALDLIKKAGFSSEKVDLIGSHGQTIFHKPTDEFINGFNKKSTLQIGEAAIISERTGITTISDFRPADIAAGGQGAPLVCFADEIMFKSDTLSRAVQNIGGMANVTVLSPNNDTFAFDTGPGNVIINYCTKKYFGEDFDKDGQIASKGAIDEDWLNKILQEEYYNLKPPKTTGRELFSPEYTEKILLTAPQNPDSIISTVTELTAKTIFDAYSQFVFTKTAINEIILGGGGAYNTELVKRLKKYFGNQIKVLRHEDFGISDKFKEAIAFAFLAYAAFYKIPNNVPSCTGAKHKTILGKISPANRAC